MNDPRDHGPTREVSDTPEPPDEKTVALYDSLAGTYDEHLSTPADCTERRLFHTLSEVLLRASTTSPPCVLDFGCGTGLDTIPFLSRGRRVTAWDPSTRMIEILQTKALDLREGSDRLQICPDFSALEEIVENGTRFDLVTANFGVLNHIEEPAPTFAFFERCLAPGGAVLASILNPWHPPSFGRWWWWRGLLRGLAGGKRMLVVPAAAASTYRHFPSRLARASGTPLVRIGSIWGGKFRTGPFRLWGRHLFLAFSHSTKSKDHA